jgi:wyosine [tRNA(Phe)-imidazoG37] synthetase (radical SAM superfamily)
MKYVFGPVPSRRLGRSLGVDPIPFKTCNWNCVYCQLGRTQPLTNERKEYVPANDVVAEVRKALRAQGDAVDWITFGGSGEPTLHASLGRMIREVKGLTTVPVAVLTNGALLHRPEVRRDLLAADAVLPTLDAGCEAVYRRVNRARGDLTFMSLVEGLVAFRSEYSGRLWVEVMLVRGLNDSARSLREIADILDRIRPDAVHVNTAVRPPAEPWVQPPTARTVRRALSVLGHDARLPTLGGPALDLSRSPHAADAVRAILTRHPMDLRELRGVLPQWTAARVAESFAGPRAPKGVAAVSRAGRRFCTDARARYGEAGRLSRSQCGSRSEQPAQKVDPRTSTAATDPAKRIKQA